MMKKSILRPLCIALSACILIGCGKTEGEAQRNLSTEGGNIIKDGTNDPETKENISNGKGEDIKNDNNNQGASNADNLKNDGITQEDNRQDVDITFELLKDYKEKNIPSVYTEDNKNEYCCNVLLNDNNEIEYYTVSEEEDGCHIWKYLLRQDIAADSASDSANPWITQNGICWEREPVLWLEAVKAKISHGRIVPFLGEDHNNYAWYMGNEEKAHLIKQTDHSYEEIPISDWRITEQATVAVLANGNVVSADAGRECFVYNPENGSLLTHFKCGWYESICVRENMIYISTQGGTSVQRYDAQKQEFLPTIEAGFDKSVRIALQEDDVYVCTPDGIFRAKESAAGFQKVMEAGNFHFAKETGVLLKFFVIGDVFYVVYGEDKGNIKKYAPAGQEEEATKSLTIYSLESNEVILDMISEFQDRYPDIELIYETGEGAEGSITTSDRIRALNARILAGDGPDILLLDGLPADSYIEKGILEDLNPMLGSGKEELLPNIRSVYTVQDKIYTLPLRLTIPMFMTSGQEPECYSTLEALVEYSEAEGGVAGTLYTRADFLQILYYNYRPNFVSEDGTVNREDVAEFLSLVKRFCDSEQPAEVDVWAGSYLLGRSWMGLAFAAGDGELAFLIVNGLYGLGTNPAAAEARGGELHDNKGIFFPRGLLSVNQMSAKKELSRLFIEFAFSYEVQNRYVALSGYPIHTKILEEYTQVDSSGTVERNSTIKLRCYTAEESAQMVKVVEKVNQPVTVEKNIWEIILGASEGYLKGTKGLDECVDEMVGRLQLYLYEQ